MKCIHIVAALAVVCLMPLAAGAETLVAQTAEHRYQLRMKFVIRLERAHADSS